MTETTPIAIMRARRYTNEFDDSDDQTGDRTILGGLRTGTRAWLYFVLCLLALIGFGTLLLSVDRRMDEALQTMQRMLRIDDLTQAVERGTYSLQARQREFMISRDIAIAEAYAFDLNEVSTALDELFALEDARALSQDVTTIRDGLVQYDEQFQAFIETERRIDAGDGSGLSAQLQQSSSSLKAIFRETGNANLINQVERIDQQGEETILSGSKKGVEELRQRYDALRAFIGASTMTGNVAQRVDEILRAHETQMLSIINARFDLAAEARRFDDLFEYVEPSLRALVGFAERERIAASAAVRNTHLFSRYTLAAGAIAIVLWLTFFGLLFIKSLSSPAKRITDAVERLMRGAAHVSIPAQGNRDDFGRLARLLDSLAETVIEAGDLQSQLDRIRTQMDQSGGNTAELKTRLREAEDRANEAEAAAAVARDEATDARRQAQRAIAELSDREATSSASAEPRKPKPQPTYTVPDIVPEDTGSGPIRSVSEQLQNYTQYVTAAANDVERTEALIRGIDQLNDFVSDIGDLVITIRDQTNILAFRSPGKEALSDGGADDDNLVTLSPDGRRYDAERAYAQKFGKLREATDRTEQTALRIKSTLQEVSDIARGIAETASHQALDATHRLLHQSEYLQHMLDDILNKIQPARPGQLSAPQQDARRSKDDPFS